MRNNFVSVSSVSNMKQLEEIGELVQKEDLLFPIVIGYQVSNKSINKGTQNSRQPKFEDLGRLDRETRSYGLITAIHYYTKDEKTVLSDIERIVNIGVRPNSTLLQFNTLPLDIETLRTAKDKGFKIILPVTVSNIKEGGYSVWKGEGVQDVSSRELEPLLEQVRERREVIDYVLFDPSHGTNLELDLNEESLAIRFGKRIISDEKTKNLGLVYAGGIKPINVKEITKSLHKSFPKGVSIDVESGVRNEDVLDLELVKEYLIGYKEAIKE